VCQTVVFEFYPANHSVVRAEYGFPCIPYEMTGEGKAGNGFFSGFHPVATVLDNVSHFPVVPPPPHLLTSIQPPTWSILINNTDPMFFYCSAPSSCISYGMVGVINPNASTPLDRQRDLALNASYALSPGEPFPAEGSPAPEPPSSTSAPMFMPQSSANSGSKLGKGAIAGIAVACSLVAILGLILFYFWGRFKGLRDEMHRKDSTIVRTSSPHSPRLRGTSWWPPSWSAQQLAHQHEQSVMQQRSPAYTATETSPTTLQQRSPVYANTETLSPMSAHAKPDANFHNVNSNLPPAYYPTPLSSPMPELGPQNQNRAFNNIEGPGIATIAAAAGAGGGRTVSWSTSQRSSGGHWDLSPKGYYTRVQPSQTHNHSSDMTSPTDPSLVPVGPYGRQTMDLQRSTARYA
jgi:hypothetical protein